MNSNAELNMIIELDLDPIKVKLMHKESGEGWSLEQANAVEFEYRRFLCLMKLFPEEQMAPLFDVDIFWHYHILDTMKYAVDCEQIFGYFLHHFPYIGLSGEDDDAAHDQVGKRMKELYEATFGEAYIRQDEASAIAVTTAYSANVAQNDSVYSVRPALDLHALTAITAYCANAGQSDSCHSVRPELAARALTARSAYCANAPENKKFQSVRLVSSGPALTATTAYCANIAQNDRTFSVRSMFDVHGQTAGTAYSASAVQSSRAYSVPLALAQAA